MTVKPWITHPGDIAYIEMYQRRRDELWKEHKKVLRRIEEREHRVWESGGRERFLAAQSAPIATRDGATEGVHFDGSET